VLRDECRYLPMSATAGCTPNPQGRRKERSTTWWGGRRDRHIDAERAQEPIGHRSPAAVTTTGGVASSDSVRTPSTSETATSNRVRTRYMDGSSARSRRAIHQGVAVDDGSEIAGPGLVGRPSRHVVNRAAGTSPSPPPGER